MTTLLLKDPLRKVVERESGGLQTVLYTANNQPSIFNIVPKFDMSVIDSTMSGTHPAFIVDGVEKDVIYIGTYQGVVINNELLSLPDQNPTGLLTQAQFQAYAKNCGANFHIMTNAERAAIALRSAIEGTLPLGNNNYGASTEDATQKGERLDGGIAGVAPTNLFDRLTAKAGICYTGSGPIRWRHNNAYNGISDLSGNGNEIISGLRLYNGEIQIIENNNAANQANDSSGTSTAWKAIDATNGNLVTPNGLGTTANTVKIVNSGIANYSLTIPPGLSTLFHTLVNSISAAISDAALARLKRLALFPIWNNAAMTGSDYIKANTTGINGAHFGGSQYSGGNDSGMFNLALNDPMDTWQQNIVFARPCYYK